MFKMVRGGTETYEVNDNAVADADDAKYLPYLAAEVAALPQLVRVAVAQYLDDENDREDEDTRIFC